MSKPTLPEVVSDFAAYYRRPGNGAWGSLHTVLEDDNNTDNDVDACADYARTKGDTEGERLARVLRCMSRTQRGKLAREVSMRCL